MTAPLVPGLTALAIGVTCFAFLVIAFLLIMGMCAVASAADDEMERLIDEARK